MKTVVSLSFAFVLAVLALASGCSAAPQARVVAVDGARFAHNTTTVMVLVEIENPTDQTLMLSGLDYQVEAKDWFTARGSYALSRYLVPGDVAYIEVPLPVKNFDMALGAPDAALKGVHFELTGQLRALRREGGELAWDVRQEGALAPIVEVRDVHRERHPARQQIRVHMSVGAGS